MPFSLDQSFIVAAEEKLGAKLPYSYRHAMMKDNGGAVQADGDYWHLYPIRDNSDRNRLKRSCNDILYETRLMREWRGWPENALAIASNGTSDCLILLKEGRLYDPAVYMWRHDTGDLVVVAEVFSDLKRAL